MNNARIANGKEIEFYNNRYDGDLEYHAKYVVYAIENISIDDDDLEEVVAELSDENEISLIVDLIDLYSKNEFKLRIILENISDHDTVIMETLQSGCENLDNYELFAEIAWDEFGENYFKELDSDCAAKLFQRFEGKNFWYDKLANEKYISSDDFYYHINEILEASDEDLLKISEQLAHEVNSMYSDVWGRRDKQLTVLEKIAARSEELLEKMFEEEDIYGWSLEDLGVETLSRENYKQDREENRITAHL